MRKGQALSVPATLVRFIMQGLFTRWAFGAASPLLLAALAKALVVAGLMALTLALVD